MNALLDAMKREVLAPGAAVSTAERAAIAAAKNVHEYDDRFIAPRFGYRDAQDHYESNAAKHFLDGIARPTLVLHPAACYTSIDWSRLPIIEAVLTDLPLILWTPDQAAWRSACSGVIYPRAECSR